MPFFCKNSIVSNSWRKGWDSNPRTGSSPITRFRVERVTASSLPFRTGIGVLEYRVEGKLFFLQGGAANAGSLPAALPGRPARQDGPPLPLHSALFAHRAGNKRQGADLHAVTAFRCCPDCCPALLLRDHPPCMPSMPGQGQWRRRRRGSGKGDRGGAPAFSALRGALAAGCGY